MKTLVLQVVYHDDTPLDLQQVAFKLNNVLDDICELSDGECSCRRHHATYEIVHEDEA